MCSASFCSTPAENVRCALYCVCVYVFIHVTFLCVCARVDDVLVMHFIYAGSLFSIKMLMHCTRCVQCIGCVVYTVNVHAIYKQCL